MKFIPLTREMFAMVDDADYESLSQHKWFASSSRKGSRFYAARWDCDPSPKKLILMHRLLSNADDNQLVDHRDTNSLNNQRWNLRACTKSQNCKNARLYKNNRLGIKGVRLHQSGKYEARIQSDGTPVYLGLFLTVEEALSARLRAGDKFHGEFFRQE